MSGRALPASGDDRRDPDVASLAALEADLAAVHPLLHRAELAADDLGIPVAPLYLASARGSVRHVSACIAHHAARGLASWDVGEVVEGSGIRLRTIADRPGLGERFRADGQGSGAVAGGDLPPWASRPDLGADLVASPLASSTCGGPVGSTLLFCALAHHRWLHLATRTKWSTDASGAAALVSAINGGGSCAMPLTGPLVGLVDREVADVLATLGWTRMLSPSMP